MASAPGGNVLLGGSAGWYGPRGGILGALGNDTPFVAKFSPDGALCWSRAFNRAWGAVTALAVLPGDAVGFAGVFGGIFDFGGPPIHTAMPNRLQGPDDVMLGTLSPSGEDGWVKGRPHRWSRLLGTGETGVPLSVAPGGQVRVAASFTADGVVDGHRFASRGQNDVLLLELVP